MINLAEYITIAPGSHPISIVLISVLESLRLIRSKYIIRTYLFIVPEMFKFCSRHIDGNK